MINYTNIRLVFTLIYVLPAVQMLLNFGLPWGIINIVLFSGQMLLSFYIISDVH